MRERKPDVITDLWYKSAVIYNCDVRTYLDANGDGVGDFRGLQRRLDYLAGLGITALWLMPFYPSPDRDDGYDITDYLAVDPRLGDLGGVRERHLRGGRERRGPGGALRNEAEVRVAARALKEAGVESVAICFLYSYLSPKHEQQAAQVLAEEFPEALVSLSSDVLLAMTGPT